MVTVRGRASDLGYVGQEPFFAPQPQPHHDQPHLNKPDQPRQPCSDHVLSAITRSATATPHTDFTPPVTEASTEPVPSRGLFAAAAQVDE